MAKGKKIVEMALAAALFAGCAGTVVAQDVAGAITARKAAMKQVGIASVKLRSPSLTGADARAAGTNIGNHTKTFAANLPKGSGPESGQVTKALPAIWTNAAGWKAEMDKATKANAALAKVSDDPAAIKAAAAAVSATCTSCHDKFRAK